MTVRETLKRAFDKSGMTYTAFAGLVGVSLSSAHKKLNGEQVLTLEDAEAWAKLLKVSISAKVK
jgi:transcriptional regulator with XRE-family HTH domain